MTGQKPLRFLAVPLGPPFSIPLLAYSHDLGQVGVFPSSLVRTVRSLPAQACLPPQFSCKFGTDVVDALITDPRFFARWANPEVPVSWLTFFFSPTVLRRLSSLLKSLNSKFTLESSPLPRISPSSGSGFSRDLL